MIVNWVADEFDTLHGENPLLDLQSYQDLYTRALTAKIQLSSRQRTVFVLRFVEEMDLGEIAVATSLPVSTVKSHLSSAFGKLGVRSRNEAVNLIMDSERGFGMGILALGGEPIDAGAGAASS